LIKGGKTGTLSENANDKERVILSRAADGNENLLKIEGRKERKSRQAVRRDLKGKDSPYSFSPTDPDV